MKVLQKNIYWLICTIALAIIVSYGLHTEKVPRPRFCISNNVETQEISIYEAEDGNCYVFLPSYADLEHVTVVMSSGQQISLGGLKLSNGMTCEEFVLETAYPLEINGRQEALLWFYKSSNVATLYIDTATGTMDYIHKDKNNTETASVALYTSDGTIDYLDHSAVLSGRGNTTWNQPKKPYALQLSSEGNLLGMGNATNWILLANALDETNLNNKLVFDLAKQVGCSWTPENEYVDVYLNGQYNGLYLLTEKLETGNNRLDIRTDQGDFLCKFERQKRWDSLKNPFETRYGRTVEISSPEIPSQAEKDRIIALVNQMEQIILSESDLRTETIIDLDSWVRRYLIDEISANDDSDNLSSYFYYANGVFYAGPVWDYDLAFGYSKSYTPSMFAAYKTIVPDTQTAPYYRALYQNDTFYQRMIDIYETEFLPVVDEMLNGGIHKIAAHIEFASKANRLRWKSMFDSYATWNNSVDRTADDLCSYLADRMTFLSSIWIDDVDYCTVYFKMSSQDVYRIITVKKGACLQEKSDDLLNTSWINESTEEIFDFSQPINTDISLIAQENEGEKVYEPLILATQDIIVIFSVFSIIAIFVCLLIVDFYQRKSERKVRING